MAERIIEENITNRLKSYKSTLQTDGSPDGEKYYKSTQISQIHFADEWVA